MPRSGRLLTSTFFGSVKMATDMTKLSWVLIFVVAIGLANDMNTALAGPYSDNVYQGNGNDDEPSDDIGDDQSDDDEDHGDDGDRQ